AAAPDVRAAQHRHALADPRSLADAHGRRHERVVHHVRPAGGEGVVAVDDRGPGADHDAVLDRHRLGRADRAVRAHADVVADADGRAGPAPGGLLWRPPEALE